MQTVSVKVTNAESATPSREFLYATDRPSFVPSYLFADRGWNTYHDLKEDFKRVPIGEHYWKDTLLGSGYIEVGKVKGSKQVVLAEITDCAFFIDKDNKRKVKWPVLHAIPITELTTWDVYGDVLVTEAELKKVHPDNFMPCAIVNDWSLVGFRKEYSKENGTDLDLHEVWLRIRIAATDAAV